ncbi:MAG: PKD domain-containing protein [Bacteroidota bacterium]
MMQRKSLFLLPVLALFSYFSLLGQTASPIEGCVDLTVNFTPPAGSTAFFWDFKNGSTSSNAEPSTIYTNPGVYEVEFSEGQGQPVAGTVTITVYPKPELSFAADTLRGCTPFAVTFTDESTIDPAIDVTALNWTFGDGNSSTGNPVTHIYNTNGIFDIGLQLEAVQENCGITVNVPSLIDVSSAPQTAFTAAPNSACEAPLTVSFGNTTVVGDNSTVSYAWDFGNGNTSTAQNPPPQTYTSEGQFTVTLTATEDNGCVNTFTRVISIGDPLANFDIPDTICINTEIEIINTSAIGLYSWQFGPTADPSFSNVANPIVIFDQEGEVDITLSVTTFDGACTGDTTITVFVDEADASFVSDPSYSCSEPFEINYTSLSDEPIMWEWIFYDGNTAAASDTSYTFVNLDTTTFGENGRIFDTTFLVVTNPSGCVDTSFQVDTIHLPNALFMPDVVDGCAPLTVMFSDSSTSNEQIIRYEYDYGDGNTAVFTNDDTHSYTFNDPGEYEVILNIENEGGCLDTSYAILIEVGEEINLDFAVSATNICPGDTVSFTNLTPPDNVDAWHFQTDNGRSHHCYQEPELEWAFGTETGPMDVTLIAEYNGCLSELTREDLITVNGPIARLDYEIDCENPFDVTFRDSSIEATILTWDFGDTTTSNLADLIHTYDTTGNYMVTLTAENPGTGCPASVDSALVCIRDLQAEFELDTILCVGQEYDLDATLSEDVDATCWKGFNWFFDRNGRPITTQDTITSFVFGQSGDETVTLVVEDVNGCFDTTAIDVRLFDITSDFELDDDFICTNGTVPVNFTDQSTADTTIVEWMWSFGSTAQNPSHIFTDIIPAGDSIAVTLTVTDEVGCPATSEQFITVYRPISAILANPSLAICVGTEVEFTGIDFTAGGSNLSFAWDFGNGNTDTGISVSETFDMEGDFPVTLDYTEIASGCSGEAVVQVRVQDFPEAAFSYDKEDQDIICLSDGQIVFTDQSSSNFPLTYSWNFDNGSPLSIAQNPTITFDKGVFDVELTVSTPFGCMDSITRQIEVLGPDGDISISDDLICLGDEVVLELINDSDVEQFVWDIQGDFIEDENPLIYPFDMSAVAGLQTIPIRLQLTGTSGQCVTTIDTVVTLQTVIADFSADASACADVDVQFTNLSQGANSFEWDFDNGQTSAEVNPVLQFDEEDTYNVTLVATSPEGCTDELTQAIVIDEIQGIGISISPEQDTFCLNDSISLMATLNPPFEVQSYTWFYNDALVDGVDSTVFSVDQIRPLNEMPISDPLPPAFFTVEVVGANGCVGDTTIMLPIEACAQVLAPNVFTPNNDGTNDFFNVVSDEVIGSLEGADVQILEFKIWNRWGTLVYDNENPTQGWDGTKDGNDAPVDVYFYQVIYRALPESEEFVLTGDVTLLR